VVTDEILSGTVEWVRKIYESDVPPHRKQVEHLPMIVRLTSFWFPPHEYVARIWGMTPYRIADDYPQRIPHPYNSDTPAGYYVVFAYCPGENAYIVPLIPEEGFAFDEGGWEAALQRYQELVDQAEILAMEHIL
jgi:hypothetical protein